MKRIKSYAIFESTNEQNDIRDILLELIDSNKIRFGFNDDNKKGKWVMIRTKEADKPLYWEDISDYILRIIDYLGDRYIICRIRKHPNYREDRHSNINTDFDYIDLDINEDTNINYGLWSVAIKWI